MDNFVLTNGLHLLGFEHTAFVLRTEGRLERSSHFNDHVPRGELVELLTKALLYLEVETHWRGDTMLTECKTPFSLLRRHECTSEAVPNDVNGSRGESNHVKSNGVTESVQKRKADTFAPGDTRFEKRAKRSAEPEAEDQSSRITEGAFYPVDIQVLLTV